MVKREVAADVDVNSPLPKRRRDAESNEPATEDVEMGDADASSEREENERVEAPAMSPEEVTEEGLKVWHTVKDAVDKEGRPLTPLFMRLPSKRQYPDYYEIIKNPIALDDVKIKLDEGTYSSLEEVRQDFELCFKNAKKYNQRESVIWKDAKTLQKLANKEIDKIVRRGEEDDVDVEGSGDEEGKKKEKGTNIHRLMKNRLQKLSSKTDENGRLIAAAFMDLPSRKKWPIYYKLIKRPICIEDIFKKIKRKDYNTVKEFMDDVELVFSNAMEFNEDHSEIWMDAVTMRDYFHQIMNHLPRKYGLHKADDQEPNTPSEAAPKKIMLKVPLAGGSKDVKGASTTPFQITNTNGSTTVATSQQVPGLGSSADITVPKQSNGLPNATPATKKSKVKSPSITPAKISTPTAVPTASSSTPAQDKAQATTQAGPAYLTRPSFSATPMAGTTTYTYSANHYTPQNYYASQATKASVTPAPSAAPTPAPARTSSTPAPTTSTSTLQTSKPTASIHPSAAGLRCVRLVTKPVGRKLDLSSEDGVKTWAMRLVGGETSLTVRGICFSVEEEEEEGEEGEDDHGEEDKGDSAAPTPETPKKKRGRGRPRKLANVRKAAAEAKEQVPVAKPAASTASPKHRRTTSSVPSVEDVVVKLDGLQIQSKSKDDEATEGTVVDGDGEWDVEVSTGSHVLEIGKNGNSVSWKVYLERRSG